MGGYVINTTYFGGSLDGILAPVGVKGEGGYDQMWVNDWAVVHDEFEEGGFKQSGRGRLNGLAAMEDFVEYKHIALNAQLAATA